MREDETLVPEHRHLTYTAMLDDYVQRAGSRGVALEATALRTESVAMVDILAHGASGGELSAPEVMSRVLHEGPEGLDPLWLAKMARVVSLQNHHANGIEFALEALRYVIRHLPLDSATNRFHFLYVELLITQGEFDRAEKVIREIPELKRKYYAYLSKELQNPFINPSARSMTNWISGFNAPFRGRKMRGVILAGDAPSAFDRLTAPEVLGPAPPGPLVSVIMTTYSPDREEVLLSARSILAQSWTNLELLVVDDASPDTYARILTELEGLDPRVRLIRQEVNGGTYLARNRGLAEAQGEYVTGQDADDWSHPDRILTSVRYLQENPQVPGVVSFAIRCNEQLGRVFVAKPPFAESAISFMAATHLLRELGGYLPARRAADNELRHRLGAYVGTSVGILKEPLMIVRIRGTSLSRADFRAGWSHPARHAFRHSYQFWHAYAQRDQLRLEPHPEAVSIPQRFEVTPRPTETFDVVFIGDWQQYGGPQISMMNEIRALLKVGLKVGIMSLEACRFMSSAPKPLCAPIRRMVHDGEVTQLLPDDAADIRLAILRYPPILQFPSSRPVEADVENLLIVANQAPCERNGQDIRYIPSVCSDHAEELFGVRALWVPQGPSAREALAGLLHEDEMARFDMPGIIDTAQWRTDRSYFRSNIPVIGRHSRDHVMKWPNDPSDLVAAYPESDDIDVRVLGGATTVADQLPRKRLPANWVVYGPDEVPVREFLNSLDFYVYYDNPVSREAFGRAVLEALAAGCVTVLPWHFEATFGKAALYAEPGEVESIVRELYMNTEMFIDQAHRSMDAVDRYFSYRSYQERIGVLLGRSGSLVEAQGGL